MGTSQAPDFTDSDPQWTPLLEWIDQAMLNGAAAHPLPAPLRQVIEGWGIRLSDEPVDAFHEILALVMPLYHTRPARPAASGLRPTKAPPPTRSWTPEQETVIQRLVQTPGMPGAREAHWLIQRNGWSWPESAVPYLLNHFQHHPRDWEVWGPSLPPMAQWLARQGSGYLTAWPTNPPNLRELGFAQLPTYLFRWIRTLPETALPWLEAHHHQLDGQVWESFLDQFGDLLPPPSLDLLGLRTQEAPTDRRQLWCRARARLGDTGLLQEVAERLDAMWMMESGTPTLTLPGAGSAWLWSGLTELPTPFHRTPALYNLASSIPPAYWTRRTGLDPATFISTVFQVDQHRIWVNLLYHQLCSIPDPEWCLAFLTHHLQAPEIILDGPILLLTRHIPSTHLSPVVESGIRQSRFQLWLDRPEGQLLTSPGLYWTEPLLDAVFHAFQMRPALAFEVSESEPFITALAWRSHLGGMLRRSSGKGLQQFLPGPLSRLAPHIMEVIHLRQDLHRAFHRGPTSRA